MSGVNENRTKTNLVVIVEAAIYRNVNNMYKPMEDLESFENGNVEIGSNGMEEEYADPSNNEEHDSHHNEATNSVSKSDNKQVDSRLTGEVTDGSAPNEDGTHATLGDTPSIAATEFPDSDKKGSIDQLFKDSSSEAEGLSEDSGNQEHVPDLL